jgi:hypothetical protein
MKGIRNITNQLLSRRSFIHTTTAIATAVLSGAASKPLRADPAATPDPLSRNPSTNPFFGTWKVCLTRFPGGAVA